MVNHILRRKQLQDQGIAVGERKPEPTVRIRNLTGVKQSWGTYTLSPDPSVWTEVPKSLADRLAEEPESYEIWNKRRNAFHARWKIHPSEIRLRKPGKGKWPWVRIVIPVFNSPDLLKQCLDSLKLTDYPRMAITLVDNASTDPETRKMVKAHAKAATVRFDKPVGFSEAVNAGMRLGKAKYQVLFNQDCMVVDPDWLRNIVLWMEKRKECAVVGPQLVYPYKQGETPRVQHAGIVIPAGATGTHRYLGVPADTPEIGFFEKMAAVTGAVFAIRSSVLDEVGYFDEHLKFGCEDIEFCLRVSAKAGHEVWYVPTSTVVHHDHGVQNSNTKDAARIQEWRNQSSRLFRAQWGTYIDRCAEQRVSFILPDYNPISGGCRVICALANRFVQAGIRTAVYCTENTLPDDPDLRRLFEVRHISNLHKTDILIATRFDTVKASKHIEALKRYYLVQQIETPMAKYCGKTEADVLYSYQQRDYEIITIGQHLAEQLTDLGRTSTVLDVGLYVDRYPYKPHGRGEKFRVLMYGSSADYKGANDNALIAERLRKLLGNSVEINSFHKMAQAPSWADNHYRPQRTSEVAAVYSDHDVYVYPSLSDGFAMTPVEAMACGTPVVLTDFPGKDQYARDCENCVIAPFRDIEAVAGTVVDLSMSPDVCDALRIEGRRAAERYDWSAVGAQYVKHILGAPL